jgi:hypothetical protein
VSETTLPRHHPRYVVHAASKLSGHRVLKNAENAGQ